MPVSGPLYTAQHPLFSMFIGGLAAHQAQDRETIASLFKNIISGTRGVSDLPPFSALSEIKLASPFHASYADQKSGTERPPSLARAPIDLELDRRESGGWGGVRRRAGAWVEDAVVGTRGGGIEGAGRAFEFCLTLDFLICVVGPTPTAPEMNYNSWLLDGFHVRPGGGVLEICGRMRIEVRDLVGFWVVSEGGLGYM